MNRRIVSIIVAVALVVAGAVALAYRWDRSGVDVVTKAAVGSDAVVTGALDDQEADGSKLDKRVQLECGTKAIERAFSDCESEFKQTLRRGGEINLAWGPHAQRLGKPVDSSDESLDYATYREAFVAVLDAGKETELIRMIYCARLGKCRVTYCRPSALPRGAASSLASLNRECRAVGHHQSQKALRREGGE